jgi:hypothetical protein
MSWTVIKDQISCLLDCCLLCTVYCVLCNCFVLCVSLSFFVDLRWFLCARLRWSFCGDTNKLLNKRGLVGEETKP